MVDPKFTSLTSTAKFQKLNLLATYQNTIVSEEERKVSQSRSESEVAMAIREDTNRLNELVLNQAKYYIDLTKVSQED